MLLYRKLAAPRKLAPSAMRTQISLSLITKFDA
jgi:hypothetical protein